VNRFPDTSTSSPLSRIGSELHAQKICFPSPKLFSLQN
jgi:hypothetical protein